MKIQIRSEIAEDTLGYFRTLPPVFSKYRRALLLFVLFLLLLTYLLIPYDHTISKQIVAVRTQPWIGLAWAFRDWGAFLDTVTATLLIFGAGWIFRRRNWRRLAVTLFLSSSLAGIVVNIPRVLTGRPRPYVGVEDRWYGPVFLYPRSWIPGDRKKPSAFQSFPSGHTAATVASSAMLLTAAPAIGIPMALSSTGVVWSCLYANKHYATDVAMGAGLGIIFGVAGGLAFRRMRAKDDQSAR
jgi:membrane-associated phospholipid phosphatase